MKITFTKKIKSKIPVMIETLVVGYISKNIGWAGSNNWVYTKADSNQIEAQFYKLKDLKKWLVLNLKPTRFELSLIEEIKKWSTNYGK